MTKLEMSVKDVDCLYPERSKYNNYGTIIKKLDEVSARQLINDTEKQIADVQKAIEYHQNMAESIEDFFLKKTHAEILAKRQEEYRHIMQNQPDVWMTNLKELINQAETISIDSVNGQKQRDALFKDLMLTSCVCNRNYRVDDNEEGNKATIMLFGSVCSIEEVMDRNSQNSQRMDEMKEQYVRSVGMSHDREIRNFIPSRTGMKRAF